MLRADRRNDAPFSVFYPAAPKQGRGSPRRRERRQMPAKKKPAKKKPARRSSPQFRFPVLEQRQLDLIGLALVGLGLFFAFLVYFGWAGGPAGSQAGERLRWLVRAAPNPRPPRRRAPARRLGVPPPRPRRLPPP